MIIATAILLPLTVGRERLKARFSSGASASLEVSPSGTYRTRLLLVLSGLFLALHFAAWITSLSYTSVLHSTVLVTIHPLIVLFASAMVFRQPVTLVRGIATVVAFAGAVILATGGSLSGRMPTLRGDLLALLGGVAVAGYLMIGGWARHHVSASRYNLTVHGVAAVALIALAILMNRPLWPYPPREFALFAALAFFCTILGHSLMNWALKTVRASDVSLAILLEPVFASSLAAILFQEIPGPRTLVGAVIVLGAMAVIRLHRG
jgi:drug/metabolite transporter (DMT)-like permease